MKKQSNIELCLSELGFAVVPIEGTSMLPLLKEGKALVEVAAKDLKQLKKGDVVLYRKKGGTLVLHRIIKAEDGEVFTVLGDHQITNAEQVHKEQILAVAEGFIINGRHIDEKTRWYRIYKKIWTGSLEVRRCCLAFLRLSGIEKSKK